MFYPAGLHHDIDTKTYHADALRDEVTLSSGVAGTLLSKTPRHARAAHPRLNEEPIDTGTDKVMDIGSVAHELILGKGGGYVEADYDDWRTKAAKAFREEVEFSGKTPILLKHMVRAEGIRDAAMAALDCTPDCHDFFDAGSKSEVVGIWQDVGGPWCRMMLDRLTPNATIYDIKTTDRGIGTRSLESKIDTGLALQLGFYMRGLAQLCPEMSGRFKWRWVFVEQQEPYEVRIEEPMGEVLEVGDRLAARAIAKWQRCMETGEWPGYPRVVGRLGLPQWAEARVAEAEFEDIDARRMVLMRSAPIERPAPDQIIFGDSVINLEVK